MDERINIKSDDIENENSDKNTSMEENPTTNAKEVDGEGIETESDQEEEQLREQLLRALADTENIRRRAKKDVQEASQFAITNFARDILSVADNMNRALEAIPNQILDKDDSMAAIADGIEMTARELESIFERHSIKRIDPLGEKFDYNLHQAMFESSEAKEEDGTVIDVLQHGYMIGTRLLRPAMVGVAKSASTKNSDTQPDQSDIKNADNPENDAEAIENK